MKAETLKKSILQYAMEGKLVPQDPNDEPASELLKRIKAEKEQLIKEGKIKKDKTESYIFKGEDNKYYEQIGSKTIDITDEIPFEIPQGWEWCRLKSILLKLTDGTHHTPKYTSSGVPFLSVKDMSSGKLNFNNTKFISQEEHAVLYKRCNPEKGDLLVTKVGTTGVPVIVDTDKEFSLFVSVALLKFNNNFLNIKFLYYLILSPLVKEQAKTNTKGIGNQNWVIDKIANTFITIPPLSEQQRIVDKLEQILPLIDEYKINEEKLSKLNETLPAKIKQSILQHAVQGKLVEQDPNDEPASELLKCIKAEKEQLIKEGKIKKDKTESYIYKGEDNNYYEQIGSKTIDITDEIPFEIPQGWEWVRLGNIVKLTSGQDLTPDMYNSTEKGIPYLTGASNIIDERIVINRWTENGRAFAYAGNLLITCKGTVGTMAILKQEKVHIARQIMAIEPFGKINILYVKLFLNSYIMALKVCAKSIIPGISRNDVLNILFPLPSYDEQKRIVARIVELTTIIDNL